MKKLIVSDRNSAASVPYLILRKRKDDDQANFTHKS